MKSRWGVWLAGGLVLAFLLLFFVLPVGKVFITAFLDGDGSFTVGHFSAFFSQGLLPRPRDRHERVWGEKHAKRS